MQQQMAAMQANANAQLAAAKQEAAAAKQEAAVAKQHLQQQVAAAQAKAKAQEQARLKSERDAREIAEQAQAAKLLAGCSACLPLIGLLLRPSLPPRLTSLHPDCSIDLGSELFYAVP